MLIVRDFILYAYFYILLKLGEEVTSMKSEFFFSSLNARTITYLNYLNSSS